MNYTDWEIISSYGNPVVKADLYGVHERSLSLASKRNQAWLHGSDGRVDEVDVGGYLTWRVMWIS